MTYLDYLKQYFAFNRLNDGRFDLNFSDRRAILAEDTIQTNFDGHYIYHPAWAARILAKTRPKEHVDISSSLHFCSLVSAFVPVKFYDYRPAPLKLSGLTTSRADLTNLFFKTASVKSLSCMHTVEHIGLGRYGDPLDPQGDLKAMKELARVLAPKGDLLFVVPIGKPRIVFNAHRIYGISQIRSYFPDLKLKELSVLPDGKYEEGLVRNPTTAFCNKQNYACGCFHFTKL